MSDCRTRLGSQAFKGHPEGLVPSGPLEQQFTSWLSSGCLFEGVATSPVSTLCFHTVPFVFFALGSHHNNTNIRLTNLKTPQKLICFCSVKQIVHIFSLSGDNLSQVNKALSQRWDLRPCFYGRHCITLKCIAGHVALEFEATV